MADREESGGILRAAGASPLYGKCHFHLFIYTIRHALCLRDGFRNLGKRVDGVRARAVPTERSIELRRGIQKTKQRTNRDGKREKKEEA